MVKLRKVARCRMHDTGPSPNSYSQHQHATPTLVGPLINEVVLLRESQQSHYDPYKHGLLGRDSAVDFIDPSDAWASTRTSDPSNLPSKP